MATEVVDVKALEARLAAAQEIAAAAQAEAKQAREELALANNAPKFLIEEGFIRITGPFKPKTFAPKTFRTIVEMAPKVLEALDAAKL